MTPGTSTTSRRSFVTACLVGGVIGSGWVSGMAAIARARYPRISVLGNAGWQVLLLEEHRARILILSGTFKLSPIAEIDHLMGLLRQRLDVLAGTREALSLVDAGYRERRRVATVVELDPASVAGGSGLHMALRDPLEVRLPSVTLTLARPTGESWMAHARSGQVTVAIGPDLDTAAKHGPIDSVMVIAPVGSIQQVRRLRPHAAIVTNDRTADDEITPRFVDRPDAEPSMLVRTFDRDVATFSIRDGRLTLPSWAQDVRLEGQ